MQLEDDRPKWQRASRLRTSSELTKDHQVPSRRQDNLPVASRDALFHPASLDDESANRAHSLHAQRNLPLQQSSKKQA